MGCVWLFLVLLCYSVNEVKGKSQYVMPMSMGMKMGVPYDIANLFIRPIAGVVSVAISVGLLFILFFGVITSPFGYFFGIPSKKYVLGNSDDMLTASPRLFSNFVQSPSSLDSLFYWMDAKDLGANCQLLALCHAHAAFQVLPPKVHEIYSIFSGTLVDLPSEYKRAIVIGLGDDRGLCATEFSSCPQSGFSLLVKTLLSFLPEKVKNEHFRKRKGPMYMKQSSSFSS